MQRFLSRFASLIAIAIGLVAMSSCNDDDKEILPEKITPTFDVSVNKIQRTQVDFSIKSDAAADYAYVIKESGSSYSPTAEELFETGTIGQFENGVATVTTLDVEGGKTFDLYVAVRSINPYVYSEVSKIDLSTNIDYSDIVTLDRIGKTDFRYHVEYPEGARSVKHVIVKKTDYEAIKSILAMFGEVSYESYLKVFGHDVSEPTDVAIDKFQAYGFDTNIHVYTATDYLLMGGVVTETGDIDPANFKCIEFQTRPAGVCPNDIQVSITTTSTTASISLTPDPEITDYRVYVDKKDEFDYWRREGEAQIRSVVIGYWDDSTNPVQRAYSGNVVIEPKGLVPNTNYVIGIVGFDSERRECVKYIDFRTGEPVGPKPEITISKASDGITAPWKSAAYNVKVKNAVSAIYGFFVKSQVDEVLSYGTSMSDIIKNNGMYATDDQFNGMISSDGVTFETSELQPNTQYVFGVYAVNDEYVSECKTVTFTTDMLPILGGEVRNNMPGHYTASTTDENGAIVTFPVTIKTGVNNATETEYFQANRLVSIGFGPASKFPYSSPADLISAGKSEAEANQLYGPKWFIEFREDGIVVPKPEGLKWKMGNFGTEKDSYLWAIGTRPSTGGPIDNLYDFPVEVSNDGNTITVNGWYNKNVGCYYYPSMCTASSEWFYSDIQFRSYSNIVLTRTTENSAYLHNRAIKSPKKIIIRAFDHSQKNNRLKSADMLKSK